MTTLETLQDILIDEFEVAREQLVPGAELAALGVDSLDLLPVVPDFSSASEIQNQLEPVGMRDEVKREFTVMAKGHSISLDTETLVYGAVAYRDVFGCKRQTRFTYVLATKGRFMRLAGFPEYNAHL